MMIYKVQQRKLTFAEGRFDGYAEIGYYTTKERAEEIANNTERNLCRGEVEIIEIEVNE